MLFELRIKLKQSQWGGIDILQEILLQQDISLQNIITTNDLKHYFISIYATNEQKLRGLVGSLKALGLKNISFRVRSLKKSQWQDKWKKEFKPFYLIKAIKVVHSWMKSKTKLGNHIIIDPAMAFGTGMHETTFFMAQLMERCRGQFTSFLDVGTGSGILSILASQFEADQISAIDFDPESVKAAQKNFKENKCHVALKKSNLKDLSARVKYDFVAANLVTADLIQFKEKLTKLIKPGKYLAVSGISTEKCREFRTKFKTDSLRCLKIIKGKQWCAFLFKRISNKKEVT